MTEVTRPLTVRLLPIPKSPNLPGDCLTCRNVLRLFKMAMPLLSTKLYIPPPGPNLVHRPRLVERLDEGLHLGKKLTLVSAPAGFGKTTILSEWVASADRPVGWITLDESDNDPIRFWSYLVTALQTIQPDIGGSALQVLQSPQPPPVRTILTGLVNQTTQLPAPVILVLDDLHAIAAPEITGDLGFLLDNLSPRMHLVVSTRTDPPWPLGRMRAGREMTELRIEDLRFTINEVTAFLNDVMKLELSPENVVALDTHTEGWIAGLQMAALSMQGRDPSSFVQAFSGSHRFILDYLLEEVLERQSPEIQEFLLKTSILDRLTAPLCEAVLEAGRQKTEVRSKESNEGSRAQEGDVRPPASDLQVPTSAYQTLLEHLESSNLFVIPLDDERRWYRYHHLFADLLRVHLSQAQPEQTSELHRRASDWYERSGLIADAVHHALAASDYERAARLVEGNALVLMDHGQLSTLLEWMRALPDQVARSRPWLCIAHAWALAYSGQVERVEPLLERAQAGLARADGEGGTASRGDRAGENHILGHIAAIRSFCAWLAGDAARSAELAQESLDKLPGHDVTTRGFVVLRLAAGLALSGEMARGVQIAAEAMSISRATHNTHIAVKVLCELAMMEVRRGRFRDAFEVCQEALQVAADHEKQSRGRLLAAGCAHGYMSRILREWNDLEAARHHASLAIELSKQWGEAETMADGYFHMARALRALGDSEGALEALTEAREIARGLSPLYESTIEAEKVALLLARGDTSAAGRWMEKCNLSPDDQVGHHDFIRYDTLARVLLAQGRLDDAKRVAARLLDLAENANRVSAVVHFSVLQAMIFQAQGDQGQALRHLGRALTLGESEGYVRYFIDEGAPVGELLRQAVAQGICVSYAAKLLTALEGEATDVAPAAGRVAPGLSEPLSDRELEVLRLLESRLSTREIAEQLFVSVHTVRTHVKSIYSKLDVHSRMEAVLRAKELNLL
jgi:LuxR family maltose regulon positive regulatory protein